MTALDWTRIPYFDGLDRLGIERVQAAAHVRQVTAGAAIFYEGEPSAGLHVIADGLVRIYRVNPEGRLHTLSLLNAGAAFNDVAAVDGETNPYNATAVTLSEVWVISHAAFLNLMAADRRLMSNTVQALAHLNRDYIERLEDMTFRTIPSRLAKLFLYETTYADQICEAPSRLTQEEIAAILGTTREVVGRALRALLNAGLLRRRGRAVYIGDRDALERLAEKNIMPGDVPVAGGD